jgi:NADH-quinone oxidoreductase subunit L
MILSISSAVTRFALLASEHTDEVHPVEAGDGGALAAWAWLIVVVPLVASLVILFFGKRLPRKGWEVAVAALGFVAVYGVALVIANGVEGIVYQNQVEVAQIGSFTIEWGWVVDGLSILMYFLVGVVGLLVFIYALSYMEGDVRFTWFFSAFTLFAGGMLVLVSAPNLIQLIVGWELVGVSSYLLIGHYWEDFSNVDSANKAFMINKVGDAALFIGAIIMAVSVGSFRFSEVGRVVAEGDPGSALAQFGFWAGLLLFVGAMGKSAQFPLHVWLPDAMAGPTPVSALMHAATMVTAGVYLLARLFPFYLDPSGLFAGEVRTFIMIIGGITLFFMGLLAFVQNDIKKVLAYSTVSQLGYMVAAMGAGAYTAGLFHLFTHAFFKGLLFLGAGSVIHAVHSNNMSDMGGLRKYMKYTYWTFLVGTAALVGLFPFSGFWSKDEIIASALFNARGSGAAAAWFMVVLSIGGALVTAFYMSRAVSLTFFGTYKGEQEPHESPRVMTYPMVALAFFATWIGLLNIPGITDTFTDLVNTRAFPMGDHHAESVDFPLLLIVTPLVLLGLFLGWRAFGRDRDTQAQRDSFRIPVLYPLLDHNYYIDDFYLDGIMRPTMGPLARAVLWVDMHVVDGVVNGAAGAVRQWATGVDVVDQVAVDGVYNLTGATTDATGGFLRLFFSGRVQQYAALSFAGVVVIAALFIIF